MFQKIRLIESHKRRFQKRTPEMPREARPASSQSADPGVWEAHSIALFSWLSSTILLQLSFSIAFFMALSQTSIHSFATRGSPRGIRGARFAALPGGTTPPPPCPIVGPGWLHYFSSSGPPPAAPGPFPGPLPSLSRQRREPSPGTFRFWLAPGTLRAPSGRPSWTVPGKSPPNSDNFGPF